MKNHHFAPIAFAVIFILNSAGLAISSQKFTGQSTLRNSHHSNYAIPVPHLNQEIVTATLVDGTNRIEIKPQVGASRTVGAGFNPLSKVKSVIILYDSHAKVHISNPSPQLEVCLDNSQNPSDSITLIRFSVKSDQRQVPFGLARPSTGKSTEYNKDNILPTSIEEIKTQNPRCSTQQKTYLIKPTTHLTKGEYAIVVGKMGTYESYYDFGVD